MKKVDGVEETGSVTADPDALSEEENRPMFKAICSECKKECEVPFEPTEGKPVRCKECFQKYRRDRPQRRGFNDRGSSGGFNRGPRQMHSAVCSECGKKCEVPFKPTEGKPVKCKECYMSSK